MVEDPTEGRSDLVVVTRSGNLDRTGRHNSRGNVFEVEQD